VGLATAGRVVNSFASVEVAGNKLLTFNKLRGVDGIRIPEYTTDINVAYDWLRKDGVAVVARTKLRGHSGDGIVLVSEKDGTLPPAPLYVKYVKKQQEFRVHVAFGEVIDVQEKRQRKDYTGDVNHQVRNHHTGWVYCREEIQAPAGLQAMAIATVLALGLDFGAVDLIYNRKGDAIYVLEVNTAPGLEGTTVDNYAAVFAKNLRPIEDFTPTTNFGIRS
jgi:glutathione synthase/RimK-type ligase-like ATP-grasp enzyme